MDNKICRLCSENNATSNIFENGSQIHDKIVYCCRNLKIMECDGLPSHICWDCERELNSCYQFICKCETSDKILREEAYAVLNKEIADVETKIEVKTELNGDEDEINFDLDYEDLTEELKPINSDIKPKRKYTKRKKYKIKESVCRVCSRKCNSPSALAIHMRKHTNEKPFHCHSCIKQYKDNYTLKRHIERKHTGSFKREKKFICETCGKNFYSKHDIKIHLRVHTGETPYKCPVCLKQFTQISSFLRHKMRHTGERPHGCPKCPKKFKTKDELRMHAGVHTKEKKYSCPLCNVTIKYLTNLRKHMRSKHGEPETFICNYCGRTLNNKGALKIHIDRHHSEKSGYCNICCKDMSNIEVHMRRHTGERPLQCGLCSSSFYELRALSHHMNFKHKKTDRHKCTVEGCLKSFPSKPMLDFHTAKVHSTKIPFPCDRCSRGFYRKSDLARHKLGTHKEKLI